MKESKTETGPICSNGPVKISVIGNVMLDSYIKKGHTEEKYGGILYVISTLSVLFDKQARIYPITIINNRHYDDIISVLNRYKNVNCDNVRKINQQMNRFEMYYDKDGHYYNSLCYFNNKLIPYRLIRPHLDSNLIIVSFIAGDDVELQTLKKMSRQSRSLIFGDIHNFIYDPPVRGVKNFKQIKFWKEWVDCFDIIQGSSFEWEFLLRNSQFHNDIKHLLQFSCKDIQKKFLPVAEYILMKKRPRILIITDGKYGAVVFYKKKGKVIALYESAIQHGNIKGITGCGDSFSGAFLYQYCRTGSVRKALQLGAQISSWKTQFLGLWTKKHFDLLRKRFYLDLK